MEQHLVMQCITKSNACYNCSGGRGTFPKEPVTSIYDLKETIRIRHFTDPNNFYFVEWAFHEWNQGCPVLGERGIIERSTKIHLCPKCLKDWVEG